MKRTSCPFALAATPRSLPERAVAGGGRGVFYLCDLSFGERALGHAHKNHGSKGLLTQTGKGVPHMAEDGTNRGGRRVRAGDKPTISREPG